MKKRISIGVVGCGYWGPNLIRNFRALSDCRMKAMCDVNESRLGHLHSLYPEIDGESRFETLLKRTDIDAIAIATSTRSHFSMAKAALQSGKHVLIEKPMAYTLAECEELISLATALGLVLMVGHTFLYSGPVRKIKEIVDNHDIGELRYISARRLNLGLFQKDINVAWDLAPHDISIILYIMQELPHRVDCRGAAHVTKGIEDVTSMTLQFSKERFAIVHSSWHDPRKIREMTIVGSKRMIVYDDVAAHEKVKIYDVRVERPPHYDTFAAFHYAYHYGDTYSPYVKQDEPLQIECQHFLDCIKNGEVPLTNGSTGMDVIRILEASTASLKRNGAPIDVGTGAGTPRSLPAHANGSLGATVQPTHSHLKNGTARGPNGGRTKTSKLNGHYRTPVVSEKRIQ